MDLVTIRLDTTLGGTRVALKPRCDFIPPSPSILINICSARTTGDTSAVSHILLWSTGRGCSIPIFELSVFSPVQHLQVLNTVVKFVAVDVVNLLLSSKQTTYGLFHYKSMLQHIAILVCIWMLRSVKFAITMRNINPTSPHRMVGSSGVNPFTGPLLSIVVFHKQEDRSGRFFLFVCMRLSTWL